MCSTGRLYAVMVVEEVLQTRVVGRLGELVLRRHALDLSSCRHEVSHDGRRRCAASLCVCPEIGQPSREFV